MYGLPGLCPGVQNRVDSEATHIWMAVWRIPFPLRIQELGNEKNVVVLTRERGYQKDQTS